MYEGVQLVQNSAALNGTQRVLLDHVLSEEECAELRLLAHVRSFTDRAFVSVSVCETVFKVVFVFLS